MARFHAMKRVLVTGARGFVGREVLQPLVDRGYQVVATTSSQDGTLLESARWIRCDLLADGQAEWLVASERPTHLLHLAWYTEHGRFWGARENLSWLQSSLRLIEAFAAEGGRRAVIAGSCAEYDWTAAQPCVEFSTPLRPRSLYGVCKKALFDVASACLEASGSSFAWGRIFFLHGRHETRTRFVPSLVSSLLARRQFAMTDGLQQRDVLHASDVADALVALLDSSVSGPVNIGSGAPVRLIDIARHVAHRLDADDLVYPGALPVRPDEPYALYPDVTRLREEVGWSPRFSLGEGLDDCIDWWRGRIATEARP